MVFQGSELGAGLIAGAARVANHSTAEGCSQGDSAILPGSISASADRTGSRSGAGHLSALAGTPDSVRSARRGAGFV
jgi:hypothetical protein